jgi:hypothetical protein
MFGRLRIAAAGLAVAAGCCLGAVGTQAARAEEPPEFFTKAAVGTVAPEVKESYSLGFSRIEGHTSKSRVECEKGSGSGVVNGPKSIKEVRLRLVHCEIPGLLGGQCENRGEGTREIETNNLVGELGLITSTKDGLRLSPESGTYLMEFTCWHGNVGPIKVKGSVIAEITGAEEAGKTVAESKFRAFGDLKLAQTGGIQKYTAFLGESTGHQLENVITEGGKEREELAGQSATVVVKSVPANDIGETT